MYVCACPCTCSWTLVCVVCCSWGQPGMRWLGWFYPDPSHPPGFPLPAGSVAPTATSHLSAGTWNTRTHRKRQKTHIRAHTAVNIHTHTQTSPSVKNPPPPKHKEHSVCGGKLIVRSLSVTIPDKETGSVETDQLWATLLTFYLSTFLLNSDSSYSTEYSPKQSACFEFNTLHLYLQWCSVVMIKPNLKLNAFFFNKLVHTHNLL